jgi:endonuclease-3
MISHAQIDQTLRTLVKEQGTTTMLGRLGQKYDPFKVLISTIMSARARDEVTEVLAMKLFEKYPDAKSLAKASPKAVINIIRPIGFYNAKTKNVIGASKMLVEKFNSTVPNTLEQLIELPGVGRKVANCVLVYSFGKDAIPVDTHVHRIANRLGWVKTKTPEETEFALTNLVPQKHWQVVNDTLVAHGKTICIPGIPRCSKCPVYKYCKRVGVTRQN